MSLRQIKRQKTRSAILTAARSLVAQSNWRDLTTRQIAKEAQVSYQTLYNYFPSKVEIIRTLFIEIYVGPEDAMLAIIKNYRGDLLESINDLNAVRLKLIKDTDHQWWVLLSDYFLAPSNEARYRSANVLGLVDQSGDGFYYQILKQAQGIGQLREDVDVHLMAHTLFCIANSAGERLIFPEANFTVLQNILAQQSAQLVAPYLNDVP